MLLRRTAAAMTTAGLALGLTVAPAAAHEGHEEGPPGQHKDVFMLECEGVGPLTVEVTSAGQGRGVGRIIEGGKGVLIPTTFVFEVRNQTTGAVLFTETEELSGGKRKKNATTCTAPFFTGTLADIDGFEPAFAAELRAAGVAETDVIVAEGRIEVLLRGPIARSRR